MRIHSNKIFFPVLFSYTAFLLSWGVGQLLNRWLGEDRMFSQLVFFMVVYISLTGIAIPLFLAKKFGFSLHAPISKWRTIGGLGILILVSVVGIFFSDVLPLLTANPPSLESILKYLLLFLPMSLGICLQCFFLIPRSLEFILPKYRWTPIIIILASVIAIGICFWVDQLFTSTEIALIQMCLGIFFALGTYLTRSLPFTYGFYSIVILVNTLSEGKYFTYPWSALVIGFLSACLVIFTYFYQQRSLK